MSRKPQRTKPVDFHFRTTADFKSRMQREARRLSMTLGAYMEYCAEGKVRPNKPGAREAQLALVSARLAALHGDFRRHLRSNNGLSTLLALLREIQRDVVAVLRSDRKAFNAVVDAAFPGKLDDWSGRRGR
jgi:hypothetical protein